MVKYLSIVIALLLSGCASQQTTLYQQLGGERKLNEVVNNFVTEIENDPVILAYFEGADIDRFIAKFTEQLCVLSDGPCQYTGDTMEQVHGGMNINERDFNHTVDLFIAAMDKAQVPHRLQNQLLAKMAPTREEMLYK